MDKPAPKSSDVFQANRDRAAPLLAKLRADGIGHLIGGEIVPSISARLSRPNRLLTAPCSRRSPAAGRRISTAPRRWPRRPSSLARDARDHAQKAFASRRRRIEERAMISRCWNASIPPSLSLHGQGCDPWR